MTSNRTQSHQNDYLPCKSILLFLGACVIATAAHAQTSWAGSWAASQQVPEPANALPADDLRDATLRQVVQLSLGGDVVRVHVSNAFGTSALHLTSVHIARPTTPGQIDPATDRALTFAGHTEVTVPPAAEYLSDPVTFTVLPLSSVAVTLHLDAPPGIQTGHPGSHATSYLAHGDAVSAATLPGARSFEHWTILSAIDVAAPLKSSAIVTLGDSITDGHGSTTDGNNRWPDILAQRLQSDKKTRNLGVLNQGIGGNHLLTDGLGPNVLARFDRDVLAQTGVRTVVLFEGVNDLGALARETNVATERHAERVRDIEAAYVQIVERAHAHGLKVVAATILPYVGSDYYHPGPADEADRQRVNAWIRTPGHFDALVDFDKTMADPGHPDRLLPAYDCGDHLHPSPAGYRAMANSIPLSLLSN